MHKLTYLFATLGMVAIFSISCSDTESAKPTETAIEPNDASVTDTAYATDTITLLSSSSITESKTNLKDTTSINASSSETFSVQDTLKPTSSSSSHMEISSSSNDSANVDTSMTDSLFDPNHLRDSVLARFDMATAGYAQNPGTAQPTTSSSHTAYNFKTEKEAFYEENGCYVNIYENESGVRYLPSQKGGYFEMTSLVYPEEGVVLRLLNNSYWGGSCESDSKTFQEKCENEDGIFKDYKDGKGCSQNQKLELACAFLVDFSSTRAMLQREANLYKRGCDSTPQTQAQECSVTCRMDEEALCDTICKNLE